MAAASKPTKKSPSRGIIAIADAASWWCALVLVAFILIGIFKDGIPITSTDQDYYSHEQLEMLRGGDQGMMFLGGRNNIDRRPCDEIYVVGEGETLHTISDKCGDPFIVEQNPHIHDPDDVFPGLVIKITPAATSTSNSIIKNRKLLLR